MQGITYSVNSPCEENSKEEVTSNEIHPTQENAYLSQAGNCRERGCFRKYDIESVRISRHLPLLLVFYLAKIHEWTVLKLPFRTLYFYFKNSPAVTAHESIAIHKDVVSALLLELVRPKYGLFTRILGTDTYNISIHNLPLPYWKMELHRLFAHLLYLAFIDRIALPFRLSNLFWKSLDDPATSYDNDGLNNKDPTIQQDIVTHGNSTHLTTHFHVYCNGQCGNKHKTFWDAQVAQAVQADKDCKRNNNLGLINNWLAHCGEEDRREEDRREEDRREESDVPPERKCVQLSIGVKQDIPDFAWPSVKRHLLHHVSDADRHVYDDSETYRHVDDDSESDRHHECVPCRVLYNLLPTNVILARVIDTLRRPFLTRHEMSHGPRKQILPSLVDRFMDAFIDTNVPPWTNVIDMLPSSLRDLFTDMSFGQEMQRWSVEDQARLVRWIRNGAIISRLSRQDPSTVTYSVYIEKPAIADSGCELVAVIYRMFREPILPSLSYIGNQIEIVMR